MTNETTPRLNDAEKLARREEILWEELRNVRDLMFRILQWGVTVLASLQMAILFLRKEIKESMVGSGSLKAYDSLPIERYFIGTVFLLVVSLICCYLVARAANRYRSIKEQLMETNVYGIKHGEVRKGTRFAVYFVFLAFPLLDIAVRLWIHFEWR